MSKEEILLESRPHAAVVLLRINRPQALNALNLAMRHRLAEAFTRLDADASVRAIVLCGSERAFCAGADLHEYVDATTTDIVARDMGRLWDAVASCRKPVIAAVRGHVLGGGCELAMHADIIIAARDASFGQPEVRIGIMPGGGATQRLTRAVGKFRAMLLMLGGSPMDGEAAAAMGLASEALPDVDVEPRAMAIAQHIAALPPMAIRFVKEAVLASMNMPLDAGLALERRSFQVLFSSAEKHEGMRARLERRAPNF